MKNLLAKQETWVRSLGWEDPLEEEVAQYSCLGNPMDRGAWWATIHGVAGVGCDLVAKTTTTILYLAVCIF